jgi:hypothetical protein
MQEQNMHQCKRCGLSKEKILIGKYPEGRCKKWVDKNGKIWNGRICPDCNVLRANEVMRKAREMRKALKES